MGALYRKIYVEEASDLKSENLRRIFFCEDSKAVEKVTIFFIFVLLPSNSYGKILTFTVSQFNK